MAIKITYTFLDNKGKSSTTSMHVPTGFSFAQYIAFAQAMAQLVADLSEGAITDIGVSVPLDISGATIKSVASAIADIAKKAIIQAASTVVGTFAKWFLPTYHEEHTVGGTDQLDTADADVAALIAIYEDGVNVGGTIVTPRTLRGDPIDTVTVAREIFRKQG